MLLNQAVILVGGKGTRISKFINHKPKALVKIGKKYFLDILLKNLSRYNFKKILLLCGYKSKIFIKKYHKKNIHGMSITCAAEDKPLGTGGSLINAKKLLDKFFLLVNGDTYCDFNIFDFSKKYSNKFILQILLTKNKKNKFLQIKLKKNIVIIDKDKKQAINKNQYANAGYYLVNRSILKFIKNRTCSLENDIFPLLSKNKKISGVTYIGLNKRFIDIGTPADLARVNIFFKNVFKKPALFLDRDGVLNKDIGYLHKKKDFIWKKGIIKFIREYNNKNFYVFIITNQSGIGRGFYTEKTVNKLHLWINDKLKKNGAYIDKFYYAPYFKDSKIKKYRKNFLLRKPNTGMVNLALKEWDIDLKKSLVVGDKITDIMLANRLKIRSRLIKFNDRIV